MTNDLTEEDTLKKAILKQFSKIDDDTISVLIKEVINNNRSKLISIINSTFNEVLEDTDFKNTLKKSLSETISNNIVDTNNLITKKIYHELMNNSIFKSKVTLAITKIINDLL